MERSQTPTTPKHLVRFLSFDSGRSSIQRRDSVNQQPEWKYSFTSPEFIIKLAQILVGIICSGLYSNAITISEDTLTALVFPNIVFTSFLIITSVITISYVLGHVMPDFLIRIYNILGALLYLISGCIAIHAWYVITHHEKEKKVRKETQENMLLAQTALSFFNSILYTVDIILNYKRMWRTLFVKN